MEEAFEYDRQIKDSNLQLNCRLYGYAPVQAEGTIMAKQLYFRARHDLWELAIADSEDVDPSDLDFPEDTEANCLDYPGHSFICGGRYGTAKNFDASYMNYDDAEAIIRSCARKYINRRT